MKKRINRETIQLATAVLGLLILVAGGAPAQNDLQPVPRQGCGDDRVATLVPSNSAERGWVFLIPTDDAYVDSLNGDDNFFNFHDLHVGDIHETGSGKTRSYVKFDLRSIPHGSNIWSAELVLFATACSDSNKKTIDVHQVTDSGWTEKGITWNNAPAYNSGPTNSYSYYSTSPSACYWDVTGDVIDAFDNGKEYSAMVKFDVEDPYRWIDFCSKESPPPYPDPPAEHRPYLHVHFDPPLRLLTLDPESTLVPPGGDLKYDVTATNNDSITWSGWAGVMVEYKGNSIPANPLFGPVPFSLQPSVTKTFGLSHHIPLFAPQSDEYELFFLTDGEPEACFEFAIGYPEQYEWDDGSTENILCWVSGGDIVGLHRFDTIPGGEEIAEVGTIFGSAKHPNYAPGNGTPTSYYIWEDYTPDNNPDDCVLLTQGTTVVNKVDTDVHVWEELGTPVRVWTSHFYVGYCLTHAPYQFCLPIDETTPYVAGSAFYCGTNTPWGFDPTDLAVNQYPPQESSYGFWTVRAKY